MGETAVKKATSISNAKIQFVSLVDKAANKKTFLITKEERDKALFSTYGRIVKADAENHYVTGIVYEPMTEDSHGDFMNEAEITKAAYYFARNGSNVDIQHSFEPFKGAVVVESWIAKADFELEGQQIKKGTWLMTMEISDADVWSKIEKGQITGFSIGGTGEYGKEDVDLDAMTKSENVEKTEKVGLFMKLAKALGLYDEGNSKEPEVKKEEEIEKAGKKMSCVNKEKLQGIYNSLGEFLKEFDEPEKEPDEKTDEQPEKPENQKKPEEPEEEQNKVAKEDSEMTQQEIEKLVTDAVEKAMVAKQAEQQEEKPVEKQDGQITMEAVQKMVEEAVTKALEPVTKEEGEEIKKQEDQPEALTAESVQKMVREAVEAAVTPILKARGLPTNLNGEAVTKAAEGEHYLHGLL